VEQTAKPAPAAMLLDIRGIGPEFAAILWSEGLFRHFENRRQIAAYAGLAPTPWQSGAVDGHSFRRVEVLTGTPRRKAPPCHGAHHFRPFGPEAEPCATIAWLQHGYMDKPLVGHPTDLFVEG
jgi:hypothetical protein